MVAVYIIWRVLQPAPPQHIIIAAGAPGGSYDTFARQYSEFFKQNGFELEVRNTAGSIENFALLEDEKSGVDVALVQGGTTPEYAREKLQAVLQRLPRAAVGFLPRRAPPSADFRS